jgi:hypothetical protein
VERHARSYCSESFSLNVAQDAGQMQTILSLVAAAMGIALIPYVRPKFVQRWGLHFFSDAHH